MFIADTKRNDAVKNKNYKDRDLKRINKKSVLFNNRELSAIEYYCKKYKVTNRSKFMRETILTHILKTFDEDHPTLFDNQQLTLF